MGRRARGGGGEAGQKPSDASEGGGGADGQGKKNAQERLHRTGTRKGTLLIVAIAAFTPSSTPNALPRLLARPRARLRRPPGYAA